MEPAFSIEHTILDVLNAEKQNEGTFLVRIGVAQRFAMAYPISMHLWADSMEEQILQRKCSLRHGHPCHRRKPFVGMVTADGHAAPFC